jgi:chromosome segregation ATPase
MKEAELEGKLQKTSTELRAKKAEIHNSNQRLEKFEDVMAKAQEKTFVLEEKVRSQEDELAQSIASLSSANQKTTQLQAKTRTLSAQCETLTNGKTEVQRQLDSTAAQAKAFQKQLNETRHNLLHAEKSVRDHEKNREKAHQALEVFLGILQESGYESPSGD